MGAALIIDFCSRLCEIRGSVKITMMPQSKGVVMLNIFRLFIIFIGSVILSAPALAQYGRAPSYPEFDVSTVTSNYMGAKTPNTFVTWQLRTAR